LNKGGRFLATDERSHDALGAVLAALADVNQQLAPADRLALEEDTALVGSDGKLDSLGVTNLVLAVEHRVAERFGFEIVLTDDETLANADRVLATVATLTERVAYLVRERGGDQRSA
jgi:acyl carrier protein